MSATQEIELDAEIRAAFDALEATVPAGYFDEFESRLQARLEQEAMTDTANQIDIDAERGAAAGEPLDGRASTDSDLSDIRSLAAKTKQSVSQRVVAIESAEDEPLITSISLALKTISLPEPGKDFKVFAAGDSAKVSTAVAAREDESGLPTWIWAAISAALAAAIVFFLVRGDKREDTTRVALNEPPSGAAVTVGQPGSSATPETMGRPLDTTSGARPPPPPDSTDLTGGATDKGSELEGGATGAAVAPETNERGTRDNMPGATKTTTSGSKSARSRAGARADTGAAKDSKAKAPDDKLSADDKAADEPKKKPDTLEDLLAEASAKPKKADDKSSTAGAAPIEEPKKPARTKLDGNDVKKAMRAVDGKARACYQKYRQPGLVTIKFGVEPSGKVTSAAATGKFKDTDTGKCVADVVTTATFPAYDGPPSSFNYAFLLSQ